MHKKDESNWMMLSGLILGMFIGWIAAVLINKNKPEIKRKINRFKKIIGDENDDKIREIFGEVNDDAVRIFHETKHNLINRLKNLRVPLEEIDEKKYIQAVQDTIREMQEKITLPNDQTERFQEYLENDYQVIKNEIKKITDY